MCWWVGWQLWSQVTSTLEDMLESFLDGLLLLLDFKCCLEILIYICCHCGLNYLCSYHTAGQTIRLLVYLCVCRHSCLPNTPLVS